MLSYVHGSNENGTTAYRTSVRNIDGLRLFYREAGPPDSTPLLLLHGFPSASHQFRRVFDALGTQFRLIAPDYPGFGYSDAPPSTTSHSICIQLVADITRFARR